LAPQEADETRVGLDELEGGAADIEKIVVETWGGVGEDGGPEGGESGLEVAGRRRLKAKG
jgi:hypothetical protein